MIHTGMSLVALLTLAGWGLTGPPQSPEAASTGAGPRVAVVSASDGGGGLAELLGMSSGEVVRVDARDPDRGSMLDAALQSARLETVLIDEADAGQALDEIATLMRGSARLRAAAARGRPALVQLRREGTDGRFSLHPIATELTRTLAVNAAADAIPERSIDDPGRSASLASLGSTTEEVPRLPSLLAATTTPPPAVATVPAGNGYLMGPLMGLVLACAIIFYTHRNRLLPAIPGSGKGSAGATDRTPGHERPALEVQNPRLTEAMARIREKVRLWDAARQLAADSLGSATGAQTRGCADLAAARRGLRRAIVDPAAGAPDIQALHRTVVRAAGALRAAQRHADAARAVLESA